jgi:hypothetical protein
MSFPACCCRFTRSSGDLGLRLSACVSHRANTSRAVAVLIKSDGDLRQAARHDGELRPSQNAEKIAI